VQRVSDGCGMLAGEHIATLQPPTHLAHTCHNMPHLHSGQGAGGNSHPVTYLTFLYAPAGCATHAAVMHSRIRALM
jgi:hypothetical protein